MNELDAYLDSLGLEADDRAAMATILGKNDTVRNNAVTAHRERLAHADYTKKTMELSKERERLHREQADLTAQLQTLNKQLETGSITSAKYKAKLEAINREWGDAVLDLKELELPVSTAPAAQPAAFDPTPFEKRISTAERASAISPQVSAVLMDLRDEYVEVFGSTKGFNAEKLLAYCQENKVPLRGDRDNETGQLIGGPGAFERLYKVPEKRHEILVKTITEKAKADAQADVQARIDQLNAGRVTGERSPDSWASGSHLLSKNFQQNQADRIVATAKENGREAPPPPSQGRSAAANELGGGGAAFAQAFLNRRAKGIGFGATEKAA